MRNELIGVLEAAYPDVQDRRQHEKAVEQIEIRFEKETSKRLIEALGIFMAAYEAKTKEYGDDVSAPAFQKYGEGE